MPRKLASALTSLLAAACGATAGPGPAAGGSWRVAYNGYGHVAQATRSGVTRITLVPARPVSPADTHAALALSRRSWGDFTAEIRVRTSRQLRWPHPNPWEVGWILWHYASNQRFYYIALKPNGWELGKRDSAYPGNQRFLATGAHPVFPVGRWYTITVQQRHDVITVAAGGHRLVRVTDNEGPYRWGRVGLYTEDASATFQPLTIHAGSDPSEPAAGDPSTPKEAHARTGTR